MTIPSTRPAAGQLSVGHSITRGALALLSTQPLTWGASLLAVVAFPRLLGADALGQLAIVTTISTLASTVAGLGVSEFLVRRAAQQPETIRRDAGIALSVQLVTAFLGAIVVALAGWLWAPPSISYPLLLVALLPMLGAPAQTVLLSTLRGREMHRGYAWFNAACFGLGTLCAVLVLLAGGNVVMSTGTAGVLMILFTLLGWKLSGLRPTLPALDRRMIAALSEFIRGGFPFLSWQITLIGYGDIDRILLGVLVPATEVGWYAAAYRIISVAVFIPTLVIAPMFPALSRSVHEPETLRRTIAQTMRVLLVLMIGLAAGTIVAAPVVPDLLGWPADFEHATPLMMILAVHLPMVAIDMVLGVLLMAIHREVRFVLVGVAAAVFNVLANLVCIPFFEHTTGNGAIGASLVTVFTELFIGCGAVMLLPKSLLDPTTAWHAGRLVLAGAASVLIGLAVERLMLLELPGPPVVLAAALLAAGVSYIVVAVLLRALTLEDARTLTSRFSRSPR